MNGADQHKEEVLERLKTVFESSGKSSRAFSKSIGLKPTSFHKVLTGTAGLTIPLANSIELNHGFRSEWLLSGNGKMKVNKHNQLSPLERCLLEVSLSSIQKWHLLEILMIEKINKEKEAIMVISGASALVNGQMDKKMWELMPCPPRTGIEPARSMWS